MNLRWILTLAVLAAGCDSLDHAGPVECAALFDHVVDTRVREETGRVTDGQEPGQKLAGLLAGALGRAALEGMGEKEKYLTRCQTTLRKYQLRSCLDKQTSAELRDCGAL